MTTKCSKSVMAGIPPWRSFTLCLLFLIVGWTVQIAAAELSPSEIEFFENHVRPVLVEHCYDCHSAKAKNVKGGLLLDSRAGLLQGGDLGPAIIPGNASASLLIRAIRQDDESLSMPPKSKLTQEQIDKIAAWVNMGAPDPRTGSSSPLGSEDQRKKLDHWAFKPPVMPRIPKVKNPEWIRNPVDAFVLSKLDEKGLAPASKADKRTLIRRASYDLTGLPPTNEEVQAFLKNDSEDAYQQVVDQLLASPRYGERWGRHWLDVARYSDIKGYVLDQEKQYLHSHVYRDWVIRAFNEDMPYDRFILLQIAADRLAKEGDPDLAAMGFITLGRFYFSSVHDTIDDRIDVVTRGLQGLTVQCARCHDHKFDPIPTQDYYSLYGVFANSSDKIISCETPKERNREVADFEKGIQERTEKLNRFVAAKREEMAEIFRATVTDYFAAAAEPEKLPKSQIFLELKRLELNPVQVQRWITYMQAQSNSPIFLLWHRLAAVPKEEFGTKAPLVMEKLGAAAQSNSINRILLRELEKEPLRSMRDVGQRYGAVFSRIYSKWTNQVQEASAKSSDVPRELADPQEEELRQVLYSAESPVHPPQGTLDELKPYLYRAAWAEMDKLRAEVERWILKSPHATAYSIILEDKSSQPNPYVFVRGGPDNKGPEVPRQFLEALSPQGRMPFQTGSGRLDLAKAIASRENPLTARVLINRVWMHHFGSGLVRTPSDFGTRCEPPTHPELLDYLAIRFMDEGWSIKKLHRLIMLSSTYQQSSEVHPAYADAARAQSTKVAVAPDKRTPYEVDPENRLLWRMNRKRLEFEAMRDSLLAASGELDLKMGGRSVDLTTEPFTAKRSVYGFVDRQFLPTMLRTFDFANPDNHSPQRYTTVVPLQALFMMNSPFVTERARILSKRPELEEEQDVVKKLEKLHRIVFQREIDLYEIDRAVQFIMRFPSKQGEIPSAAAPVWQYGFGEFDSEAQRVTHFQPFSHFSGKVWQASADYPDSVAEQARLASDGGHPGKNANQSVIRRWVAPAGGEISVTSRFRNVPNKGNGVEARVVSSRSGLLARFKSSPQKRLEDLNVRSLKVEKGETIDFVADSLGDSESDEFAWSIAIETLGDDELARNGTSEWNSKADFAGPEKAAPEPFDAWAAYAQALLLSNEFMFVD